MKRRLIGVVLAVLLAGGGTAALVAYVQTAKKQAVASEVASTVYVVDGKIAKGASAEAIRAAVHVEQVPTRLKQDQAVTDLADLDGMVAAVDLLPGEQLVKARLVPAAELTTDVPDDLMQVSLLLDPERAVGGMLKPGDTVGVFLSFDPFERDTAGIEPSTTTSTTATDATTTPSSTPGKTPNMTHLEFQKVRVTSVRAVQSSGGGGVGKSDKSSADASDVTAPVSNDKLIVTLALKAPQVEQIVFAAEFGHVWLASEPAQVDESGTRLVTLGNVYTAVMP